MNTRKGIAEDHKPHKRLWSCPFQHKLNQVLDLSHQFSCLWRVRVTENVTHKGVWIGFPRVRPYEPWWEAHCPVKISTDLCLWCTSKIGVTVSKWNSCLYLSPVLCNILVRNSTGERKKTPVVSSGAMTSGIAREQLEFWRGKNLLITGCCGFLGKLVVEKILRCLPEVGTVYLLIREKNSKPQDRLLKLLGKANFSMLKQQTLLCLFPCAQEDQIFNLGLCRNCLWLKVT